MIGSFFVVAKKSFFDVLSVNPKFLEKFYLIRIGRTFALIVFVFFASFVVQKIPGTYTHRHVFRGC